MIRKGDFIQDIQQTIDTNLRKYMRSLANIFQVLERTIRNVVYENIKYKSYLLKKRQFLSEKMKENRLIRSKKLLNKIKHPVEKDLIWFFKKKVFFTKIERLTEEMIDG